MQNITPELIVVRARVQSSAGGRNIGEAVGIEVAEDVVDELDGQGEEGRRID